MLLFVWKDVFQQYCRMREGRIEADFKAVKRLKKKKQAPEPPFLTFHPR